MADFCLKCFNEMNGTHYKRYEVVEEYGICEGCACYRNVVVDLRGYGLIDRTMVLINYLFPRKEPEPQKVEWMNGTEMNDSSVCGLGYCDKTPVDNIPPCEDCEHCVSKELDF